jgi:hypothetical protein
MNIRRLLTLALTMLTLFVLASSTFAQESAEAPASDGVSGLVFIIGVGLIVGLGSYMAWTSSRESSKSDN